jgi:hypothetical protein
MECGARSCHQAWTCQRVRFLMGVPMNQILRQGVAALRLAGCLLCGCGGIGSHTVAPDRFDYTEALSSSWKQQMLINMVKLRYGDTPVFLDVASVISQYSVQTQVALQLTWAEPTVIVAPSGALWPSSLIGSPSDCRQLALACPSQGESH